jgi:hypothetical protein
MQPWSQLYSVTGASAATLLGLLFVAMSVTAPAARGHIHRNTKHLADQAFQNYLVVMLVSLFALFPTLTLRQLGGVTLALTALRAAWTVVRLYWAAMTPYDRGSRMQSLRRQVFSSIGFVLLIYSAFCMVLQRGDQRLMFAVANVLLLTSATTVAWELLLRIAADKRHSEAPDEP